MHPPGQLATLLAGFLFLCAGSAQANGFATSGWGSSAACSYFVADFSDGETAGMQLDAAWRLATGSLGTYAVGSGGGRLLSGQNAWRDYVMRVRLRRARGAAYVHLKIRGHRRYLVRLAEDRATLIRQSDWGVFEALAEAPLVLPEDAWVTLQILAHSRAIAIYRFGKPVLYWVDRGRSTWDPGGAWGFETSNGAELHIDWVRVSSGCLEPPELDRCTESDKGSQPDTYGVAFTRDGPRADTCVDQEILLEYSCDTRGFDHVARVRCSQGCREGACFIARPPVSTASPSVWCGDGRCDPVEKESCAADCAVEATADPACAGCLLGSRCVTRGARRHDQVCVAQGRVEYIQHEGACESDAACYSDACMAGTCAAAAHVEMPDCHGHMDHSAHGAMGSAPMGLMTMPGLPRWMAWLTAGLTLLAVALVGAGGRLLSRPGRPPWRYDLLRWRWLASLVKHRAFQLGVQLPVLLTFLLVIAAGLWGTDHGHSNLAPVLVWTIWWAFLVFDVAFFGRIWCLVCPWDAIATFVRNLSLYKRKSFQLSLEARWPRRLANIYPATILFIGLTWLELGYGVTAKPRATAALGLLMLGLAVSSAVVFARKAYCKYGCLVGRVIGLYSLWAPLELRRRDQSVCRACRTVDCYRGNQRGYPCPTGLNLKTLQENTYCLLCTECIKSCGHDNVAVSLRPPGADLLTGARFREDEAYMALVMLSMAFFHGVVMTPAWDDILWAAHRLVGGGYYVAFSAAMVAILIAPGALYGGLISLAQLAARGARHARLFVAFAYPLLPVALFYHLAHNAGHLLQEGQKIVPLLSDPFGWGWDLFGTAGLTLGPVASMDTIWWLQVALLVTGGAYGTAAVQRVHHVLALDGAGRRIPVIAAALMVVVCCAISIALVHSPMVMRTAM
jgi:polyferredoxin